DAAHGAIRMLLVGAGFKPARGGGPANLLTIDPELRCKVCAAGFWATRGRKEGRKLSMARARNVILCLCTGVLTLGRVAYAEGPFAGINAGYSEPMNANYRAHVEQGAHGFLYGGYMF